MLGAGGLAACGAAPPTTPTAPAPGPLTGLDAVPVGQTTVVTSANGAPVALVRPRADSVIAHSAVCTHQGCTVAPAGTTLSCPCHGSVFDATTGAVQQGPANRPLPAIAVQVQGQNVVATGG
jgi:Rieske Fe-S protein